MVTYTLKTRKSAGTHQVIIAHIVGLLKTGTSVDWRNYFSPFENVLPEVNDKHWLGLLTGYIPEGWKPADILRWLRISEMIDDLKDEHGTEVTFSRTQANLLHKRMTDPEFVKRLGNLASAYAAFVNDFSKAGNFPDEIEDDDDGKNKSDG